MKPSSTSNQFLILFQGGLFNRLMTWLGFGGCSNREIARRTLFLTAVVWLPPLVLGGIGSLLSEETIQLKIFNDISFHVRCLIAIPLLIAIECRIQDEFRSVLPAIKARGMFSREMTPVLEKIDSRVESLQTSVVVDPLLLLLGASMVFGRLYFDVPGETTSWKTAESWPYVLAQMWNQWISFTFYYLLVFQWIWRFVVWSYFLLRIALLHPELKGLHPDRVGGLAFLLRLHKMFTILPLAVSSVVSSNLATLVLVGNIPIDAFLDPLLVYLFLFATFLTIPLFAFTPNLVMTRNRALIRYSRFANSYAADFERKWFLPNKEIVGKALGSPDIQSLNDLHGSYRSQAQMRISLADMRTLTVVTASIVVPLLPLLLFKFPVLHLIEVIVKYFFKI